MSKVTQIDHNEYPTCVRTYSTFRIFSNILGPDQITERLQMEPTTAFRRGQVVGRGKLKRKSHGWFYSTEKLSGSRDTRRHLDIILNALSRKRAAVKTLQARGCKMDIMSFWLSSSGQGGPWLMPDQMLKLGALGLSVWWDVYFSEEDAN